MAFGHVFEILNLICVANTTIVHFPLSIVHCEQLLAKPEFRSSFLRGGEWGEKGRMLFLRLATFSRKSRGSSVAYFSTSKGLLCVQIGKIILEKANSICYNEYAKLY